MAPSLETVQAETVRACAEAMTACADTTETRSVFMDRGRPVPKFREMGETLNRLGGFTAMLQVADALQAHAVRGPEVWMLDLRELDVCWGGIGEWQF